MPRLADLALLCESLDEFSRRNRKKAARNLANAEVFLVLEGPRARVHPLHWLLHVRQPGKSFSDSKRSNQSLDIVTRDLAKDGYRRIHPGDAGFEDAWDALITACRDLGTAPSRRSNGQDWTGRSFFVRTGKAPDRAAVLAAMTTVARDGLPEGFKQPRVWFVQHPGTGDFLPAKAVWGLATGQRGSEFISHQARDKLRALGFVVPGPDDPAADLAMTPAEFAAHPGLIEGAVRQVTTNVRERNPQARRDAEAHFRARNAGRLRCEGCGIDFALTYGPRGDGFMHFHHLNPIALAEGPRSIIGTEHLIPLCPNCHAMVHRGDTMWDLGELRASISGKAPGDPNENAVKPG